jgi:hypothetical protein
LISGDDAHAVIACDWPGCLASLEMDNVDSREPALAGIRRIAAQHYGWRRDSLRLEPGYGRRKCEPLDICPEHDAG